MLETSARLLRLLTLLQSTRFWPGRELAERLEITDRTLRRDADRLRTLGYPVWSTSGPAGGYSLGVGVSLPPLMLDDDEGVAVAMGLQSAVGSPISGVEGASLRALAKIEQVLPLRLRRRLKSLRSSIVRLGGRGPLVKMDAVATLATCCSEQREIRFRYRDRVGSSTERHAEPHRIVHMERHWYLVAWDQGRQDWRTFRIDRIEPPLTVGDLFTARSPPDDDVARFVTNAVSSHYGIRARVVLRAPLEEIRRRIPAHIGLLERIDDRSCRLVTSATSLHEMAAWLGVFDVDLDVEEPPALVHHLHLVAKRFARAQHLRPRR